MAENTHFKGSTPEKLAEALLRPLKRDATAARPQKDKRGRPARPMPEPIPDTLENIAKAVLNTPPKNDWDYLKEEAPADN